jgi:hypothetical protein
MDATHHRFARGIAVLAIPLAACSSAAPNNDAPPDSDDAGSASSGASSSDDDSGITLSATVNPNGSGGSSDTDKCGPSSSDCKEETTYIYVISTFGVLFRFKPKTNVFEKVGPLQCPGTSLVVSPGAMSVARTGVAWVMYTDGHLYNVDIHTAACTATTFSPSQPGIHLGYATGLAFVANPADCSETLYVAAPGSNGQLALATIDTKTLALNMVGSMPNLAGGGADLTGTGGGSLFGFFSGSGPSKVAVIDTATAKVGLTGTPSIPANPGAQELSFAFAFWAGEHYLFSGANNFNSRLDDFNLIAGKTTMVQKDVGFEASGAGVSTCAPVIKLN